MSGVRVLVGTRKGAFILTSDAKRTEWEVSGPYFAGWEIYHLKGSPVDPNRLYASQSTGWFGQLIQRSDDGGKTWEPVGNTFEYGGNRLRNGSTARSTPGVQACGILEPSLAPTRTRSRHEGRRAVSQRRRRSTWRNCRDCAGSQGTSVAAEQAGWATPSCWTRTCQRIFV